jgi:DNA invertase Pin-like site-specific DNA recombinase
MAKFSRAFAQFKREMMLERQREGIAKVKPENRFPQRSRHAQPNWRQPVKQLPQSSLGETSFRRIESNFILDGHKNES